MRPQADTTSGSVSTRCPRRRRLDEGSTFIELLVGIVLLGTVVIGVLVALQASTVASDTDAEHARAFALLHAASDHVFLETRLSCDGNSEASIIAAYSATLNSVTKPEGWGSVTPVITNIEFLNASDASGSTVYSWGPLCFEGVVGTDDYTDLPLKSQKVTITVTNPGGKFSKTIETVKR